MLERLHHYFPTLSPLQQQQFAQLQVLYEEWNAKINVISRKDIANLYLHHVLHSLAIGRAFSFVPATRILDVGTGGGFPGVPLAILLPHCRFTLLDGTAKKIRVVSEVVAALGLENVVAAQRRVEEEHGEYDFVVSRAVMPLRDLHRMVRKNISPQHRNAQMNGIIVLKGGAVEGEVQPFPRRHVEVLPISDYFVEEWFKEKYIIYLPC